ncbi:TetR/AcrR family transcriptional regulator [Skermania sp. ID1734]|uniref:TetR/AcrR family transcriptional regulator n=1 Tax=Skermania sp. ID1734 TaxID=2597516 RepID=UPI00117E9266|nr:TetR/AcrR family transcriptional regulator [Skermania sp. ID1734]TSE01162.1 TetR/AcrR family transcriptional regulator [Skermania sp. ID1734]
MARTLDHAKRAELLADVVTYISEHGLANLSLRPLAAALGTSSRMLIYYFGTKEEMLVQALTSHRPDIAAVFADVSDTAGLRQRLIEFSAENQAGTSATSVKVLLQVLGAACAPNSPYAQYANAAIETFVASLSAALRRIEGIDDPEAVATLLISGLRGVLQDRFITGDVERTERAARLLIAQTLP